MTNRLGTLRFRVSQGISPPADLSNLVVAVYLHAFTDMNEARWPNLEARLDDDVHLLLPGPSAPEKK